MTHLLLLPTFDDHNRPQGFVEIPAGTNRKKEIDKETGIIRQDARDGLVFYVFRRTWRDEGDGVGR